MSGKVDGRSSFARHQGGQASVCIKKKLRRFLYQADLKDVTLLLFLSALNLLPGGLYIFFFKMPFAARILCNLSLILYPSTNSFGVFDLDCIHISKLVMKGFLLSVYFSFYSCLDELLLFLK